MVVFHGDPVEFNHIIGEFLLQNSKFFPCVSNMNVVSNN